MQAPFSMGSREPFFHGATQIFLGARKTFTHVVDFSDHELGLMFAAVCGDVSYVLEHHGATFLKGLNPDAIDLSDVQTSFYDVALMHLNIPMEKISHDTYERRCRLLEIKISTDIAKVMTHFFRYLLRELQSNPMLVPVQAEQ